MKMFIGGGKWNFVDKNNVLVGYDNQSDCCEDFGYYITKERIFSKNGDFEDVEAKTNLDEYDFDQSFCDSFSDENDSEGGLVTFRLVNSQAQELFLTLYNYHNGYYGHGFDMKWGEKYLYTGSL